jgi:hypothetical protein
VASTFGGWGRAREAFLNGGIVCEVTALALGEDDDE